MTGRMITRMVWKDLRTVRQLWLVFALGTLGIMIAYPWLMRLGNSAVTLNEITGAMCVLAVILPLVYGAACSCVMFANEHEERTYEWLRALPATPRRLLAAKLSVSWVTTIVMALALLAIAVTINRDAFLRRLHGFTEAVGGDEIVRQLASIGGVYLLAVAEVVLVGLLSSMLVRRTVTAAFLMVILLFVVNLVALSVADIAFSIDPFGGSEEDVYAFWRGKVFVLVVLTLLNSLLVGRWFGWRKSQTISFTDRNIARGDRVTSTWKRHLLWHQFRQAKWYLVGLAVTCTVSSIFILQGIIGLDITGFDGRQIAPFIWFFMPPIWGALVFAADNESYRFRYFTQRGVNPKAVWYSRQLFGLLGLLAMYLIYCLLRLAILDRQSAPRFVGTADVGTVTLFAFNTFSWLYPLAAYSFGHVCSMFLRHILVAGFVAVVLNGIFGV